MPTAPNIPAVRQIIRVEVIRGRKVRCSICKQFNLPREVVALIEQDHRRWPVCPGCRDRENSLARQLLHTLEREMKEEDSCRK